MPRRLSPHARDPLTWLVAAAIVALLVGVAVPGIVTSRGIQLPVGRTFAAAASDPQALIYRDGATQPATLQIKRTTRTAKAQVDSVAGVDTTVAIEADGAGLAQLEQAVELNRESTYPQAGGKNTQILNGQELDQPEAEAEGLQYFFPADTEKRSYPFFDALLQASVPIDYAEKERIEDLDAYVYRQAIPPTPLPKAVAGALGISRAIGPASNFFTAQEMDAFGLDVHTSVELDPFYAATREVKVDPATGTILDIHEDIHLVFAATAAQAEQGINSGLRPAKRALADASLRWDETTRAAALELAKPTVHLHKAMNALSWLGKALAVILLACAATVYLRRRPHA